MGLVGDARAHFPYWSFTKTVTAICALKLVETGDLELDAPCGEHAYTLRQLLQHTSGLPDYGQVRAYHEAVAAGDVPWSREKMLHHAMSGGVLFAPGTGWSYSNIGYMFLREVIEAATHRPLGDLIADQITDPLGLDSVRFAMGPDDFADLHWKEAARYDPRWVYHGCLTGNARDAARLLHALFGGELLSSTLLAQMNHRYPLGGPLPGRPWESCGYGLGLMSGSVKTVGRIIGHSGAGPFCVNAVYHFPDLNTPVTIASFTGGTDEGVAEFEAVRLARHHVRSDPRTA